MKTFHYFNYNSWLSDTLYYQLFQQFYENGKHFYCKEFSGLVENVEKFYEDLEQISGLKKVFEKISMRTGKIPSLNYPKSLISLWSPLNACTYFLSSDNS